ncbi:ABC transporter permease [Brevundimonas terrae]|uniref:ABC transporter permease n=2 Tax=Brevundimonas terrae TaxID=363631 RepID=A0ABN0Y9S7_9CAUL
MIGSASVVALMSFSHIAKTEVMERFQEVGVNTVQIEADFTASQGLDALRLDTTLRDDPQVDAMGNMAIGQGYVRVGNESLSAAIAAVSPDILDMLHLATVQGRNLTRLDGCNGAVVLGAKLAKDARAGTGDTAYIEGYGFQIVGVFPFTEQQALNPVNPDQTAFIGLECSRRVVRKLGITHALVRVGEGRDPSEWAENARNDLMQQGQTVAVRTSKDMIAAMNSQMNLMSAILVAIGSVSLLVGGVGVMNVMLMSVMERRKEIGLRAAIGATPNEIVFIFIVEAVALSVGGGLIGALVGVGLTALGCVFLPISFVFDPMVLVWGTAIAASVGLVFGIHPAVSASRILPVEALRAD